MRNVNNLILVATTTLASGNGFASSIEQLLGECWQKGTHPAMSQCVTQAAAGAEAKLRHQENKIRAGIKNKKTTPGFGYLNQAEGDFESSAKTYRAYVKSYCTFVRTLASMGNGEIDNMHACRAVLYSQRAEQLNETNAWLE